jgi:hypothetical protein
LRADDFKPVSDNNDVVILMSVFYSFFDPFTDQPYLMQRKMTNPRKSRGGGAGPRHQIKDSKAITVGRVLGCRAVPKNSRCLNLLVFCEINGRVASDRVK